MGPIPRDQNERAKKRKKNTFYLNFIQAVFTPRILYLQSSTFFCFGGSGSGSVGWYQRSAVRIQSSAKLYLQSTILNLCWKDANKEKKSPGMARFWKTLSLDLLTKCYAQLFGNSLPSEQPTPGTNPSAGQWFFFQKRDQTEQNSYAHKWIEGKTVDTKKLSTKSSYTNASMSGLTSLANRQQMANN